MTDMPPSASPLQRLHRVVQCAERLFQTEMTDTDLTPRQLAVLIAVANNDSRNLSRLVEVTGIDRSTMAELVRRLIRKGLLQSEQARFDARSYSIRLTDKGGEALADASLVARLVDERLLGALPVASRAPFSSDLECIIERFKNR